MSDAPVAPSSTPVQRRTFAWLFAVAAFLFLWTLSPIWVPVFLGLLLTIAVAPWHARWTRRWPRHPRLGAAALTAVVLTAVVAALGYVVFVVVRELVRFLQGPAARWHAEGAGFLFRGGHGAFLRKIGLTPEKLTQDFAQLSDYLVTHLSAELRGLLAIASHGLLTLFFTAITSYYLLIEGDRLIEWAVSIAPLPQEQTREIIREFRDVSRGNLIGTGVTSLFQGIAAGVGFWIFRVPDPIVWGALTTVASVVPAIGTALVWLPVGIVEIGLGHAWRGIGVLSWSAALVIGVADYILRPRIVAAQLRLHALLVFIGLFGGIEAFGLIGIILGPLFVALFVAVLRIYTRAYRPVVQRGPA